MNNSNSHDHASEEHHTGMAIQNIPDSYLIGDLVTVELEQIRVRRQHTPGGPDALDGNMTIEALPTWYGGTTFRSKLEADWAATLDTLSLTWEYEPETITLPSGTTYIPDFWLPELGTWIEVKGTGVPRVEKAVELGESRACYCDGRCTCEWPGGQLVLIGHPPIPYDPWADDDTPYWVLRRQAWRHHGHPNWSTAHGPRAYLTRCNTCHRAGWTTDYRCRPCRIPAGWASEYGIPAYASGDTELEFMDADGLPAPARKTEPGITGALAGPCPYCDAPTGKRCHDGRGGRRHDAHPARIESGLRVAAGLAAINSMELDREIQQRRDASRFYLATHQPGDTHQ